MNGQPNATAIPPIEVVTTEAIASFAFAAHAYLEPVSDGPRPDLEAAEIALDLAASAFDRIGPRLGDEERAALRRLLTDLRMTFVRKRGL